jgi:hypothetical protein
MIRLILAAALIGGLLQHVFGEQPARRQANARRHPKVRRARLKTAASANLRH